MANVKNYREQGGEVEVIGGELRISGGKITADGTQASAITKLGASPTDTEIQAAVNAIIDALVGAGIVAAGG